MQAGFKIAHLNSLLQALHLLLQLRHSIFMQSIPPATGTQVMVLASNIFIQHGVSHTKHMWLKLTKLWTKWAHIRFWHITAANLMSLSTKFHFWLVVFFPLWHKHCEECWFKHLCVSPVAYSCLICFVVTATLMAMWATYGLWATLPYLVSVQIKKWVHHLCWQWPWLLFDCLTTGGLRLMGTSFPVTE